jgi:hypothetical protein
MNALQHPSPLHSQTILGIALVLLLSSVIAQAQPTEQDTKTIASLKRFVSDSRAVEDSPAADRQIWLLFARLSWRTHDDQLPQVEAFALRPEAKPVRWCMAALLIQRNQLDAAAHVIVHDLAEDEGDRQYKMWKWWDFHFKDRANFQELNLKFAEALLHQFEKGTDSEKVAIAEMFGSGKQEAKLNIDDFKTAIGFPRKK